MKNYKVNFTILITIYNESNNIDKLIAELYKSFSGALDQFEILVVDDGSTDGAINKLENYKKQYVKSEKLCESGHLFHETCF